jgi:hypothetical protein
MYFYIRLSMCMCNVCQKSQRHSKMRPPFPTFPHLHNLYCKLTPLPNPRSIDVKQIRNRNQRNCHKPQQTTRPRYPQIVEHRMNKQRKHRRKNTPQKRIGSNRTRRIFLKRINEIVQRCLENSEEAESHADESDARSEPEYVAVGCPAEDEEAGSEKDGADHHWRQARFGSGAVAVCLEFSDVKFVVAGLC